MGAGGVGRTGSLLASPTAWTLHPSRAMLNEVTLEILNPRRARALMFPPAAIHGELRSHFLRTAAAVGQDDPYEGLETLGIYDVLRAHYCLASYFMEKGEGIGGVGPADLDMLHSALSRQHSPFNARNRWSNKFEAVATLFFGLIKNHAFYDANKRTAFLSCIIHLMKINRQITVSHKKFEDFTVDVANGELQKYVSKDDPVMNSSDFEVKTIALFLKRNTKHVDHAPRSITYKQLGKILEGFGMQFRGPDRNFMDVIRIAPRKNVEAHQAIGAKLLTMTFPGWSDTVRRGELEMIRKKLGLSERQGVSSIDFYEAIDPLDRQIVYYSEALERLAFR